MIMKTFSYVNAQSAQAIEENILPFWMHLQDQAYGGWFGCVRGDGAVERDADKSLVVHARLLWTFSAVYRVFPKPCYRQMAQKALDFLRSAFYDAQQGGYYWMVSRQGKVKDARKQTYGQAFCLYALCEYAMAFDDGTALDEARAVYTLMQTSFKDEAAGGYVEALDRQMTGALVQTRMLCDDVPAQKTMNTQLHVMEAFTSLVKIDRTPAHESGLREMIELFYQRIFDAKPGIYRCFLTASGSLYPRE